MMSAASNVSTHDNSCLALLCARDYSRCWRKNSKQKCWPSRETQSRLSAVSRMDKIRISAVVGESIPWGWMVRLLRNTFSPRVLGENVLHKGSSVLRQSGRNKPGVWQAGKFSKAAQQAGPAPVVEGQWDLEVIDTVELNVQSSQRSIVWRPYSGSCCRELLQGLGEGGLYC